MIYLASPYSHPDPLVRKTRFLLVEQCTAILLRQHEVVFSPIVHSHAIAEKFDLPGDFDFWQHYCIGMLRKADVFMILKIPGWESSKGIKAEWELARNLRLPTIFVNDEGQRSPTTWPE